MAVWTASLKSCCCLSSCSCVLLGCVSCSGLVSTVWASIEASIHEKTYLCECVGTCLLYLGMTPLAPLSAASSASSLPVLFE